MSTEILQTGMFDINMTTAFDAIKSLEAWLDIKGEDIFNFISEQKHIYVINFLKRFCISDFTILRGTLKLTCLHVTTNDDNCASIRKFGLMNLQDTIRLNTNMGNYIRSQGIDINIDDKRMEYKGKSYDLSCKADYAMPGSKEFSRNAVIRKLYEDYQINGFFCSRNVLRYGGGISIRPEFLGNLATILEDQKIQYNWATPQNKCYVLKYYANIDDYEHYTFEVKVPNEQDYIQKKNDYELQKRKWLIVNALTVIFDEMFYILPEFYSYAKFDTKIPFENIKIYTANEYIEKYNVKN